MIRRQLSYANVAATLALVFAMSGGALAASHYVITKTGQISPKVRKALKGQRGATGPAGPQGKEGASGKEGATGKEGKEGAEGKAGASAGLYDAHEGPFNLKTEAGDQTIATLANVPAGSYILSAKVSVRNKGVGTFRAVCTLTAGTDSDQAAAYLGETGTPGETETLSLLLSHTFSTTGNVALACNDQGLAAEASNADISAVQVQTLTRSTG